MDTTPNSSEPTTDADRWNKLKDYGVMLGKWSLFVVATTLAVAFTSWLAVKMGVPVPTAVPPPPIIVSDAPPPQQAVESPTQFYCGRVESITDSFTTRPWPKEVRGKLTWNVSQSGLRSGLSPMRVKEAFVAAWASWSSKVLIDPVFVEDASQALITIRFGDIDGSGRVLAWSELADGTATPKQQLYDAGERWEIEAQPTQIDLVRVAAHEIGHVLGLVHDTEDSGTLLAPIYSRTVRFPTERDIKRLLAMGYEPRPVPPGTKPSLPPITLTFDAQQILDAFEKAGYEIKPVKR